LPFKKNNINKVAILYNDLSFQNGILTRSNIQCQVTCTDPTAPSGGSCCPSCSGQLLLLF